MLMRTASAICPSLSWAADLRAWKWQAPSRPSRKGRCEPDFRRIDAKDATIWLVEAGPRILPALPPELSDYAKAALERLGVSVKTSTPVTACTANGVETAAGFIEAATIVWAAGVVASPVAQWLGVEADRAGRIQASEDLSVPGLPFIFVAGDVAAVRSPSGAQVPGIAPAAKQMGGYVGRKIAADLAGKQLPPFRYRHEGDLAVIGRGAAVVSIGRFSLKGFLGWLFWGAAHIFFLIGVRNRLAVALSWLWYYVTFHSGARLITGYDAAASPEKRDATSAGSGAAVDRTPAPHVDIRRSPRWTRSSAGEHSLHTRRVTGSIPVASTIQLLTRCFCWTFLSVGQWVGQ